jgi:hypothetical protein
MPDSAALVAMQQRLEVAGIHSQREEGVECCYALQTKFWVTDPDQTLWEIYTLDDDDLDHRGAGQDMQKILPQAPPVNGRQAIDSDVIWEHRLTEPVPAAIPLGDNSVDEVRWRGTFNLPLERAVQRRLLDEAKRVLRPGGRLFVHVLVADREFAGNPQLPGPAASVQHVPHEQIPPCAVEEAGFQSVRLIKFEAKPCFVSNGIGMREMQLEGYKPREPGEGSVSVLYKGPLRELTDDSGTVYHRGRRVCVNRTQAERLRGSVMAEQFLLFD